MNDWVCGAPSADLAAELMEAFSPDGPGRDGETVDQRGLFSWLFRGHDHLTGNKMKTHRSASRFRQDYRFLDRLDSATLSG
jgi:hypothetical protein